MTFICGRAGVCALGAVLAKHAGDQRLLDHHLTKFKEVLDWLVLFPKLMTSFPYKVRIILDC